MPTKRKAAKRTGRPAELDTTSLLDAAQELFANRGFAGATTRELARLATCNAAMIAYHFGSKDGLYQAVITRHFQHVREIYESSRNQSLDELAREWPELADPDRRQVCASLFAVGKALVLETAMHRIICRELMSGGQRVIEALSHSDVGIQTPIHDSLKALVKRGKLRPNTNLHMATIGLVGPLIYANICSPILTKVWQQQLDEAYVRELCIYLSTTLLNAWA